MSTFPSEIVACRLDQGGQEVMLLCKHGVGHKDAVYGHKGGVGYEAVVYQRVLQPLGDSTPDYYGAYTDPVTGETWLFIEYQNKAMRVSKLPVPDAMARAARWIGRFHAASEARLATAPLSFLNRYDAAYYLGWAQRTARFAGRLHRRYPWLEVLCDRIEACVSILQRLPRTVIHGEYTPFNVLLREGAVYPVDWESAAVAPGEIDLATLTEGWPADTVHECEMEYRRARWPEGIPHALERALDAAQLYLHLRWLGDRPEWTVAGNNQWRFEQLRTVGERLELIER